MEMIIFSVELEWRRVIEKLEVKKIIFKYNAIAILSIFQSEPKIVESLD